MASDEIVKDYPGLFDPDVYLKLYHGEDIDKGMLGVFEGLHNTFSDGDLQVERLLDIGTGPSVCSVISAAQRFNQIYLSDFSGPNIVFLRKWLDGRTDRRIIASRLFMNSN